MGTMNIFTRPWQSTPQLSANFSLDVAFLCWVSWIIFLLVHGRSCTQYHKRCFKLYLDCNWILQCCRDNRHTGEGFEWIRSGQRRGAETQLGFFLSGLTEAEWKHGDMME